MVQGISSRPKGFGRSGPVFVKIHIFVTPSIVAIVEILAGEKKAEPAPASDQREGRRSYEC